MSYNATMAKLTAYTLKAFALYKKKSYGYIRRLISKGEKFPGWHFTKVGTIWFAVEDKDELNIVDVPDEEDETKD